MEISNNIVPDNCQIALSLNSCDVHKFSNKIVSLTVQGTFPVMKALVKYWFWWSKVRLPQIQKCTTFE